MNSRRQLLMALGGTLAWPRFALAQQAERIYRVGWLSSGARTEPYNGAFEQRLRELGFAEGRNLVIEFRTAQGRLERLPELAADVARQNCDVFLAPETEAHLAAIKQASRDTPIVMVAIDYRWAPDVSTDGARRAQGSRQTWGDARTSRSCSRNSRLGRSTEHRC